MAFDIPVRANLRFFRCLSDSLSTWASHIPILFLASFLATILSAMSGTLLLGSLYAGFAMMILRVHQGAKPTCAICLGRSFGSRAFFP